MRAPRRFWRAPTTCSHGPQGLEATAFTILPRSSPGSATMNNPMSTQTRSASKFALKLSGFTVLGLSNKKNVLRTAEYYLRLRVGTTSFKTAKASVVGAFATWKEDFLCEACSSDVVEISIYMHRTLKDEIIAEIKSNIEALLLEQHDGVLKRKVAMLKDGRKACEISFTINVDTSGTSALDRQLAIVVSQAHKEAADVILPSLGDANASADLTSAANARIVQATDTFTPFLSKIAKFNDLVQHVTEIHPYARMAWMILSAAHFAIIAQNERDHRILDLLGTMNDVYALVLDANPLKTIDTHKQALDMLAKQTAECAHFISHYARDPSFWSRLGKHFLGGVDDKIAEFERSFRKLKATFQEGVALQTELCVLRMVSDIETIVGEASLSEMPYAAGAGYLPEKRCMAATREEILEEITDWVNSCDGNDRHRLCWLSGLAGTGKSAIAHTVARRFSEINRLGSSFFFNASMAEERGVRFLFSTIALDLADLDPEWKKSLCGVVANKRALRTTRSIDLQFNNFILEPAKSLNTVGPILIVIDAVDEIGDIDSRPQLLRTIVEHASALPPNFRILITSRPEFDIEERLGSCPLVLRKRMESVPSSARDIRHYVKSELASKPDLVQYRDGEWLEDLVGLAEGLFQWAFTACRFVKGDGETVVDHVKRLDILLSPEYSSSKLAPLDNLYLTVLKRKLAEENRSAFGLVMRSVLAAKQPLSMAALKNFVAKSSDPHHKHPVDLILPSLGSLLSGVSQTSSPVSPLHTSLRDFLLDESRSNEFHVDLSGVEDDFSLSCFNIMQDSLRFNICNLETSHLANSDISDLSNRIEKAIPDHLAYACRFWADHFCNSSLTSNLLDQLMLFLKQQFLHWLEAMSLMGAIVDAGSALYRIEGIVSAEMSTSAANFVVDASRFINAFAAPISRSAPHTYLSALPFAPAQSCISTQYAGAFRRTLSVVTGKMDAWPAVLNIMDDNSYVWSVAFAPDGKRVASGSSDNMVRIWDTQTGALVAGPCGGHTAWVTSVSFSPDGKRVSSGSSDKTIRVWDAQTGALVAGPFRGHAGPVTSVAFSPDGNRVASGSRDKTVRVWDAQTGACGAGPSTGHRNNVTSVSFSPAGNRVASGSWDTTIRIWDAMTGALVAGPFEGHNGWVTSVAFSPDGNRIASGSWDTTIRIWDAQTGEIVAGPFEGHRVMVTSIAFSPDGKRVVSGSDDMTIRVWDSQTGALVAGPFEGHGDAVISVVFSPNGKRIASSSMDKTIRIWDAQTSLHMTRSSDGHDGFIPSVAFSPNGKLLASGSSDSTVQIWDAQTGALIAGPCKGHRARVTCIVFSPDSRQVVSGSWDDTIRIWDAQTGVLVAGPFAGHDEMIKSVAFSHDGNLVASGSHDKTIRIWDVQTGASIAGPLKGHDEFIASITFSPDGKRVASGSIDATTRIWDTETGALLAGPFKGNKAGVRCVMFSHDGRRVVSGSADLTIHIWDTETGALVAAFLEGHNEFVTSVAFSHDGQRVAFCSMEGVIQILDAQMGTRVAAPFQGRGNVDAITFSHDGKRIASTHKDSTICIWDVETDAVVTEHDASAMTSDSSPNPQAFASPSSTRQLAVPANGKDVHRHHPHSRPFSLVRDDTELHNGWVLGDHGELLCWIPPIHRSGLLRPSNPVVIGRGVTLTRLDSTDFVHGDRWAECRTGSDK